MKKTIRQFKETIEIKSSIFNRIRQHRYFPAVLLLTAVLSAACVHVWQRVKVMELVHEVALLKKENAGIMDAKKKLYSEMATLSMAGRIERYAEDTLGLKLVTADRMLTLVKEKEVTPPPDELERMFSAIKRVTRYMPVVTPSTANAEGVEGIRVDSTLNRWGEK
jgi:cell division protein FtsL